MGGGSSKAAPSEADSQVNKRVSSARATDDEERAWMDIMSKQNTHASGYAKGMRKNNSKKLLETRIIFVVGGPGSGKGTHCTRLAGEFGLCHLSVGDLLRNEAAAGSERGKLLDEYMKEGKIVPMEITLEVLRSAIEDHKDKPGFLIDGFPRKLDQAKEFEDKVAKCNFVLYFECSEEEMTRRLLIRGQTSGRIDDNAETIKKRMETFHEASFPVIEYYQQAGKVKAINSEKQVEEVYEDCYHAFTSAGFAPNDIYEDKEEKALIDKLLPTLGQPAPEIVAPAGVSIDFPRGQKRALLIGLNYKQSKTKRNLGGCVKDVLCMEQALAKNLGFNVLAVTDEKSPVPLTPGNILWMLSSVAADCQSGDQILFYFSGHAGALRNGEEFSDMLFTPDDAVLAKNLVQVFNSLPEGVHFTILIDGCLSSTNQGSQETLLAQSPRGFFLASFSENEASKGLPFTSGGAMTITLLNLLKENGFSTTHTSLSDSLQASLNTLSITLHSSKFFEGSKFFLGQDSRISV